MHAMGDDSLIPISDEQAKLGQELVKAGSGLAGWFADLLGHLPEDLMGLLIGDRVRAKRIEKTAVLWHKTRERLRDRGIDPEPPSLKYAIPILEAAADEENEELQDLWARLLAAAMDPKRRDAMRQAFIYTVKEMDPLDAAVLKVIRDNGGAQWSPTGRDAIATRLACSRDEVIVSFQHLAKLDCVSFTDSSGPRIMPFLTPFGTLLMKVVSD
jgi:hypothetical protein